MVTSISTTRIGVVDGIPFRAVSAGGTEDLEPCVYCIDGCAGYELIRVASSQSLHGQAVSSAVVVASAVSVPKTFA